jgi:type II secretory pathway component PulF
MAAPRPLPAADCPLIAQAARTGRLPEVFQALAQKHEAAAKLAGKVVALLAYPLFVLHMSAIVLPILEHASFTDAGLVFDAQGYTITVLGSLGLLWLILGTLIAAYKCRSPALYALGKRLPLLKKALKLQALSDACHSVGTALHAGAVIDQAWAQVARHNTDAQMRLIAARLQATCVAGSSPTPIIQQEKFFPAEFKSLYQTGERTGGLDQAMLKLAAVFGERARSQMTVALMAYPSALMLIVVVLVLVSVVRLYAGYLDLLESLM